MTIKVVSLFCSPRFFLFSWHVAAQLRSRRQLRRWPLSRRFMKFLIEYLRFGATLVVALMKMMLRQQRRKSSWAFVRISPSWTALKLSAFLKVRHQSGRRLPKSFSGDRRQKLSHLSHQI